MDLILLRSSSRCAGDASACRRLSRLMHLRMLAVRLGIVLLPLMVLMPLVGAAQQVSAQSEAAELMARVGTPSPAAVDEFKNAGMEEGAAACAVDFGTARRWRVCWLRCRS